MRVSDQVQFVSFQGEEVHGVLESVDDPIITVTPNRTDIANGIAPENARQFVARQEFGNIIAMSKDRLFRVKKNLAFVYPDPDREAIVGLDYSAETGERLSIGSLINTLMHSQRLAAGGADGTTVEVDPAPEADPAVATAKA